MTSPEASAELFERERPRLLALAYRMLGSVSDAEDAVQDAWLRWQGARRAPQVPGAWLTTTVSRLAVDRLRRRRREPYEGPWLPEPMLTEDADLLERLEDLTQGLLLMLERLTPEERITFVLRETLGDDFRTIGAVLDAREDTCRQHYRRARQRLREGPRFDAPDRARQRRVLEALLRALSAQDRDALQEALQEDAAALHDGGGEVPAAVRPIKTSQRISKIYLHLYLAIQQDHRQPEARFLALTGEPALALLVDGRLDTVTTLALRDGKAALILGLRNPAKLRRIADALKIPLATPIAGSRPTLPGR